MPRPKTRITSCVTAPRTAIPYATESLTRRTTMRKASLGHWDPRVQQGWLYNLAGAAEDLGVDVHHTMLVINHHHTSVTPRHNNMSAFLHRLHHPMSCFVNTLLQQRGFDRMSNVWEGRAPHRMRLLDAAAMMTDLIYHRVQAVAAGLVDRPEDMPGFVFDWAMWREGCIVKVDAPVDVYFDLRFRPKTRILDFRPPLLLLALFSWNVERLIYWMRKLEAVAIRQILAVRKRPCRGAGAVLKIHPFDEPRTRATTRGGMVPSFRIGARGMIARDVRIHSCMETSAFREEYREASQDFRNGNRDRVFPYGTDKMARLFGVRVETAPHPGAIVLQPGKTREELMVERRSDSELSDEVRRVLENVKNALDDEAPDFEEFSEAANFVSPRIRSSVETVENDEVAEAVSLPMATGDSLPMATGEVAVQALRSRRKPSPDSPPRRIVVLRTRYVTKGPGFNSSADSGRRAGDEPDC